jgi:nucleoside-diphosphate-sugar epimerase
LTKILITGAESFIGANFRKYSRYRDSEEISLIDFRPEDIEFERYDVVLHLAAIVHQSKKIPESEYFRVNRYLCLRVAEQSKKAGIRQFIYLSTLKVYGDNAEGSELRNENSECFPDDFYGKSKYEAEKGLQKLEDADFKVSIIRTPLVYGEGVKANMISLIKLIDSFSILPFDKIKNKRNFTFAENLVGFIDKVIEKYISGIFIAMDDNAISTTELVNYISKYLEKKVIIFKLPQICVRVGCIFIPTIVERLYKSSEFENNKTKAELNYRPDYSTEEGIKKMVSFYLDGKKLKTKDKRKKTKEN